MLDCTCGIRTQALGLVSQGFLVSGSDLSLESIHKAKREAQKRGLSTRFECADVRSLTISESNSFDSVISFSSSLCHLDRDDVVCAVKSMARVVRPAGIVLIESFDWYNVSQRTEQLDPRSCQVGYTP